jgi:signal transduction histidine kinase
MPGVPPEAAPVLTDLQAMAENAIRSVRRLATELRPHLLDDMGLLTALEVHFEEACKRSGLMGEFRCQVPELNLAGEYATACFRIVQEAITNIVRHAEATQAVVSVEQDGESILVRVTDNGRGMDLETALAQGHFGLVGMRERASLLLAPLEIHSAPGQGTTVIVRLPKDTGSAP